MTSFCSASVECVLAVGRSADDDVDGIKVETGRAQQTRHCTS